MDRRYINIYLLLVEFYWYTYAMAAIPELAELLNTTSH